MTMFGLDEQLRNVVSRLGETEAEFMTLRFGLDEGRNGKGRSLREISSIMHADIEYLDDLEVQVISSVAALMVADETEEDDEEEQTYFSECPLCGSGLEVRGKVDYYSEVAEVVDGRIEYAGSTEYGEDMDEESDNEGNTIVYCSTCDWQMSAEG